MNTDFILLIVQAIIASSVWCRYYVAFRNGEFSSKEFMKKFEIFCYCTLLMLAMQERIVINPYIWGTNFQYRRKYFFALVEGI